MNELVFSHTGTGISHITYWYSTVRYLVLYILYGKLYWYILYCNSIFAKSFRRERYSIYNPTSSDTLVYLVYLGVRGSRFPHTLTKLEIGVMLEQKGTFSLTLKIRCYLLHILIILILYYEHR